jgi:hypothetical protein
MTTEEICTYTLHRIAMNIDKEKTRNEQLPRTFEELEQYFSQKFQHSAIVTTDGKILCHAQQCRKVAHNIPKFIEAVAELDERKSEFLQSRDKRVEPAMNVSEL